jgi:hypothetical protein
VVVCAPCSAFSFWRKSWCAVGMSPVVPCSD